MSKIMTANTYALIAYGVMMTTLWCIGTSYICTAEDINETCVDLSQFDLENKLLTE